MLTRWLVVVALVAGCKGKDTAARVEPAPAAKVVTTAGSPVDLVALTKDFEQRMYSGDDAGSVPAGTKLVEALRKVKPGSHELADAEMKLGMQLQVTGDWKGARTVLEEALAIPAAHTDHALFAHIKFQLGSLYTELREIDMAIPMLESAVQLAADAFPPGDSTHLAMKEALAAAFDFGEKYAQAEPLFREVLAAYEKEGDPNRVGRAFMNLGVNLEFQERDGEALKLYLRAVAVLATSKGYDRSALAEVHSGMGRIYRRQDNMKASIASLRKAIAVRLEAHGDPEHPLIAMDYHNLALALQDVHQLREARELCAKSLAIREAKLPAEHPQRVGTAQLCADLAAAK